MTSTQLYTVPIIPDGLRRVELIKQFADTFDYLDSISQDIFNRISSRLNVYRAEVNQLDKQIQHSDEHINHIKGSKYPIQVHSSARYPIEQNRSTFKSIFECDTDNKPSVFHYDLFHSNESDDKYTNLKSNDDTLIVLKQYEENFLQKTKTINLNGFGRLPTNIKSVISLLKHNTKENPYIQSRKTDSLNTATRMRKQVDGSIQTRNSFIENPSPLFYEQMFERSAMADINYNPTLGLVPELSLPDNLPELDNYATFVDNTVIDRTKQQMTSIAPSFSDLILPDINDLTSTTITASPVKSPEPTVSTLPLVDIPEIIPVTPASISIPAPLPSPAPVLTPSLLPTVPSISTPLTVVEEPQATTINTVDGSDDPFLIQIHNFSEKNKLKPVTKSNAADKVPSATSNIMHDIEIEMAKRRPFIAPKQEDDSDDWNDNFY
ncbi:unnamed protein product [Adineta steineri]|uniref:WASH1 WAHD domain-containing protein n=1 Tax=Adineta steineri TaxID=433720 RepID=A0A816EEV5_9BILA|nr:unnamed protein product [Adineta steineri]CAF1646921.1 unnamed protein product [Adineta steineri]